MDFLQRVRQSQPQHHDEISMLESLYENKLWHQLSLELEKSFIQANSPLLNVPNVYDEFLSSFESKINQIKFASLVYLVGKSFNNPSEAIELFNKVLQNNNKLVTEAKVCISLDISTMQIRIGATTDAKTRIEEAKEQISSMTSVEPMIHSKLYRATMEIKKVIGPPHDFYNAAVMFLSYTPMEDLDSNEKLQLATDIALSAIASEGVYNFGEVLATPILDHLDGSSVSWLKTLVVVMNKGDLIQFDSLLNHHSVDFKNIVALSTRKDFIREKAVLLSIVNYAFEKTSLERQIAFQELARVTNLPLFQIERALMKAMSLQLLKGSIDEVEQTINITWIQPRVLDKSQLNLMNSQIHAWSERVKTALLGMEDQTLELLS